MKTNTRSNRLLPGGVPKYVRIYDNGGPDCDGSIDRFTACFTGHYRKRRGDAETGKWHGERMYWQYLAMNCAPLDPQGFGQHGESRYQIDVNKWGFAPAMGRKNHLGKRIPFGELPPDCRKLVLQDYKAIWLIEQSVKPMPRLRRNEGK